MALRRYGVRVPAAPPLETILGTAANGSFSRSFSPIGMVYVTVPFQPMSPHGLPCGLVISVCSSTAPHLMVLPSAGLWPARHDPGYRPGLTVGSLLRRTPGYPGQGPSRGRRHRTRAIPPSVTSTANRNAGSTSPGWSWAYVSCGTRKFCTPLASLPLYMPGYMSMKCQPGAPANGR